jgi:hypothetical protein
MVAVPPSRPGSRRDLGPRRSDRALLGWRRWQWPHWLAFGLCFGLAHGISQRLIRAQADGQGAGSPQAFPVQAFPGESLDGLRRRLGGQPQDVRADLEALNQQRQNKQESTELEQRRVELEDRQQAEQQQAQQEKERARFDALDRQQAPTPPTPALPPQDSAPASPASRSEEPIAAPLAEPPAPARGTGLQLPSLPEAPPAPSPAAKP